MPRMTQAEVNAYIARCAKSAVETYDNGVSKESDLHGEIVQECLRRGWKPINARMDKRSTLPVGTPDFVILADRGRTFYIEAKAAKGKPSLAQQAFHAQATRLGHVCAVVRNFQDFLKVIG